MHSATEISPQGGRHMKTQSVVLLAAATAVTFACASHPPPTDHMASAIAAVRGAQVAVSQAGEVPEAALHLKLAEEQVAQARQMIERGDNERADYMTLRAYNDAELALALARQHEAREAAEAANRGGSSAPTGPAEPTPVRDDAATHEQIHNDPSSSN
jgi:type IV pilus biogenesis protein CpaD/CtpE